MAKKLAAAVGAMSIIGVLLWYFSQRPKGGEAKPSGSPQSATLSVPPTIAESCAAYPEALLEPKAEQRQNDLEAMLKRYQGEANQEIKAALGGLLGAATDAPEYYAMMESAASALNQKLLPFTKEHADSLGGKLRALWLRYPSPALRTSAKERVKDTCLPLDGDANFRTYASGLAALMGDLADRSKALADLKAHIDLSTILPAGLLASFAATVSWKDPGQARICVNPEEAPPQILIRMMHELRHAMNKDMGRRHLAYEQEKKSKSGRALIDLRVALDQERFLDELRAYAVDVHAARALIATSKDAFCQLWIPSYQVGRPVLFPNSYAALERRFASGEIVSWVAALYTFRMRSYLSESLFVDGDEEEGLKEEVRTRAYALLSELGLTP